MGINNISLTLQTRYRVRWLLPLSAELLVTGAQVLCDIFCTLRRPKLRSYPAQPWMHHAVSAAATVVGMDEGMLSIFGKDPKP